MGKCLAAFDIATACGWAVLTRDGEMSHGTFDFQQKRSSGAGMRYVLFEKELDKLHAIHQIELAVFEEVRSHMSKDKHGRPVMNVTAAHVFGGLSAILMAWCEKNSVPYISVPVQTWKISLTGKGNAAKPLVKATVEQMGFSVKTFDESDAIGIALFAEKEFC